MLGDISCAILAATPSTPWKGFAWGAVAVCCIVFLASQVLRRRRRGLSWNDAIAGYTKPVTGNVWFDALLFAGFLTTVAVVVWYFAFRT
jgi:hypothetical protein